MMLRKSLLAVVATLAALHSAKADFTFTLGTGATAFSFTSTTGGTALCAAASTHCFGSVPINTAGAQLFTASAPGVIDVSLSGNLYGAITGPVPCLNATAFNTNSYSSGAVNSVNCSLNGGIFVAQGGTWAVGATQSGTWTVQPGNTPNSVPWLITGSGTAGSAATGVVTIQGIASMTKLLVTPDSVALPANQSVNVAQMNGVTTSMNVGNPDTGTQRVAQADAVSLTPASVTSATTIFTQDMTGYGGVSVSVTSAGSATITYETSDDNSTWVATSGQASTSTGLIFEILTTTAVVGTRVFPKRGRYFRARVSSYTSGTVTVFATLLKDYPSWVPSTIITAIGGTTTQTPISTMNSANGSGAMPAAIACVLDDTSTTTLTENNFGFVRCDPNRAATFKPYSSSGSDWRYPAAASGISNTTTAVTIKAADAALRNYVTGADLMCDALGAATEVAIRDGAGGTVLWRTKVGTAGLAFSQFNFATPLRGTAATLLEVVTLTASITGACYFNAGGYIGP